LKFLLLNQTFYPDVASTAQHLSDLAVGLAERGHQVTVVTSRRAYDDPGKRFPRSEVWRGIRIIRIGSTGFGKDARWRRAADFASFLASCSFRLALLSRQDAIVALTSPPLISFLGAWLARLRGSRFFYWIMDFNPDQAIAAGWLRPGSLVAKLLDVLSGFSLRRAIRIIVLDRFMRDRISAKGVPAERVTVLPPWSHDSEVRFDREGRERFRKAHGLDGKFVVMYSGNHSPCHPLTTLLDAARKLANQTDIVFCFVGGGSEWRKIKMVTETVSDSRLSTNLLCLPYQPLSELAGSLSAADLHVVVMGDPFVGLIHPCKIYNILRVAAPVLYIGPRPSHLSDLIDTLNHEYPCTSAAHGDVARVVEEIERIRYQSSVATRQPPAHARALFSKETLLPRLIEELESS
jgi:glycosyltransferase involved in cell wall biosynthesis